MVVIFGTTCRHVAPPWISCDQSYWKPWHPHNRRCVYNGLADTTTSIIP